MSKNYCSACSTIEPELVCRNCYKQLKAENERKTKGLEEVRRKYLNSDICPECESGLAKQLAEIAKEALAEEGTTRKCACGNEKLLPKDLMCAACRGGEG